MKASPPDRADSVELARAVLDATSSWWPFETQTSGTPPHLVWAGGFVARCRQLLGGMAALVDEAADDTVGVVYRTLLETYLSGVYVLLGEDAAIERLARSLIHETHQIEVALGRETQEERPKEAKKLQLSKYKTGDGLVELVDELLAAARPDYEGWAPNIYRHHYRVLSLHDAHGGFGSLTGYTSEADGTAAVANRRPDAAQQSIFLLHHAIIHVGSFAGLWAVEVDLEISGLQRELARWEAAQPEEWPLPTSLD